LTDFGIAELGDYSEIGELAIGLGPVPATSACDLAGGASGIAVIRSAQPPGPPAPIANHNFRVITNFRIIANIRIIAKFPIANRTINSQIPNQRIPQ
jgi:hypothetical protein